MERGYIEPLAYQRNPEILSEPALEIQMGPEHPDEIALREGIHERIQAKLLKGNKEEQARPEEMLEVPPEKNEVPDLMMEEEDVLPEATGSTNRRRDEISRGRKEDNIRLEKRGHSSTVSRRKQHPAGFYSEDWDEVQLEEDEWQAPDKWQRISQMVFCNGVLEKSFCGRRSYLKSPYSTPRGWM